MLVRIFHYCCFIGRPVVVEGGIEHWPAREWTLENLCERVGSNKVNVRVNTDCEEYKVSQNHLCDLHCTTGGPKIFDLSRFLAEL